MAVKWIETTIGEQATLQRGIDITKLAQRSGSVPVISSGGVSSYHDTAAVSGPGVILGRKGVVGSVYFIGSDYWPHDTTLWVRDFHGNERRFVYYFFRWMAPRIARMDVGSANPTLNRNHVHPLQVRWPPLSEQRAIARILGTLDDKIELNRRLNETLQAIAAGLFRSWFVNFDATRAKADGHDPCPPKAVADLFPDSFLASELGEIPAGWRVGCVDDEFNLTMGQSPPGDTYNETGDGLPFYQGRADFGFRFPTRRVYCTSPTRLAKAKDTLVSVRAPVGDINMALEDCAIGRGVAAARHKTASRSYSYQFMHSIKKVFSRFEADGTVFGSIGKKDFHAIPCVVPPPELVATFERRLSSVDDRIEVNERESHTLAILRDTLIPKLISGELRIKDAERLAAAAL
jgi:type I restriction enzyme S subunit